jgi:geranylgeranyl diphosphate synthase, type I
VLSTSRELFQRRFDRLRDTVLVEVVDLIERSTAEFHPTSRLHEMASYHYGTGGKRVRAMIPLLFADAVGRSPRELVPFSAACEILHNATLVHDDLQDGDRLRRGAPTVWVKYGAPSAINLGDAMLYHTIALAQRMDVAAEQKLQIISFIIDSALRVIEGQEQEFRLMAKPEPELEDYFRMVEGKTSGLFALPLVGAAKLLGSSQQLIDGLLEASRHLGVVFQLQDDLLDVYGQKGRERPGSDIAEGKISALSAYCLKLASPEDRRWFREVLVRERTEVNDDEIDKAILLYESSGARQRVLEDLERHRLCAVSSEHLQEYPEICDLLSSIASWFLEPIGDLVQ